MGRARVGFYLFNSSTFLKGQGLEPHRGHKEGAMGTSLGLKEEGQLPEVRGSRSMKLSCSSSSGVKFQKGLLHRLS